MVSFHAFHKCGTWFRALSLPRLKLKFLHCHLYEKILCDVSIKVLCRLYSLDSDQQMLKKKPFAWLFKGMSKVQLKEYQKTNPPSANKKAFLFVYFPKYCILTDSISVTPSSYFLISTGILPETHEPRFMQKVGVMWCNILKWTVFHYFVFVFQAFCQRLWN